jgi:CHAD domain-containing protein
MEQDPSQRRLSVAELCAKYGNEEAHANQVAALALNLFDATHQLVGAPAGDRQLLAAACRLHDIGYSVNPRRHAQMGCKIILQEGLKGFTGARREDIAAAILLHPARRKRDEARAFGKRLRDPRRALRLAAYLRIADGLDYGHLQDTTIIAVRKDQRAIRARIRCGQCPQDIVIARRNSDVWRDAFPTGIRLLRAARKTSHPGPLVTPGLHACEAARRLLFLHFRALLADVDGALAAKDSAALHGVRVAIRRMRAVLRVFRKPLAQTSAARIDRDLQKLNLALGEARDLDVLIDYLASEALEGQLGHHPHWGRFVRHQGELRRLQQATVRRHLRGTSFAALQDRVGRFLRLELPRALATMPPGSLAEFGRRALVKGLRRALKLGALRHSHSPTKLHQLRIALRRVRHIGGFFGSVLGPPAAAVVKRGHAVESTLGRIRDVDLALSRIQHEGPAPPRLLIAELVGRRSATEMELSQAWRRLEKPKLLRGLRRRRQA